LSQVRSRDDRWPTLESHLCSLIPGPGSVSVAPEVGFAVRSGVSEERCGQFSAGKQRRPEFGLGASRRLPRWYMVSTGRAGGLSDSRLSPGATDHPSAGPESMRAAKLVERPPVWAMSKRQGKVLGGDRRPAVDASRKRDDDFPEPGGQEPLLPNSWTAASFPSDQTGWASSPLARPLAW